MEGRKRLGYIGAGVSGIALLVGVSLAPFWPQPSTPASTPVAAEGVTGAAGETSATTPPLAESKPEVKRVLYDGPVEHIFFHPLIAYPELAFDGDAMAQGYNDWFVTVPEFQRIIEALHARQFILIDFRHLFAEVEENGQKRLVRKELLLPEGKKPLIISVDDLNYYEYMRANGNVHRLVLDEQGRVATLTEQPDGQRVIAYENEIVPLLDDFVAKHPDFSLDGAKGVLALTGYEGILGYQTHELQSPGFEKEKAEALRVVARLKETGWSFAAHGWGHQDARRIRLQHLVWDTQRWRDEVGSLLGETMVYIYPHGSSVLPGDPKFQALLDAGFRILCSVGPQPYLVHTDQHVMMDRRHIDGIGLQQQRELLLPLFDADLVLDEVRPPQN